MFTAIYGRNGAIGYKAPLKMSDAAKQVLKMSKPLGASVRGVVKYKLP